MERVVLEVRRSLLNYAGRLALFGLFFIGWLASREWGLALGCLALFAAVVIYARFGASWVLTGQRLTQTLGLLSRSTSEVEITDIRNIQVSQGLLDRILGLGQVAVSTAGQHELEIIASGIRHPEELAAALRQRRDALRGAGAVAAAR